MEITLPRFFDLHVHFRQGPQLRSVVPWTARFCAAALVMPNTTPPIRIASPLENYRDEIISSAGNESGNCFQPLMTFKILPDTHVNTLRPLKEAGAVAGKVYPRGLTTNAEDGVEDFFALYPVFAAMEALGLVLCLHGEMPGKDIDGMDRERAFLKTLIFIARTFPRLKIVMEHITTAAAVDTILLLPNNVAATITVHHLLLTHDDVGGDKMRPHHYCKPVAKLQADRTALIQAAISGCPKFFFGSDSAPHAKEKKECSECCAGIFTAPVILPLLAEIFAKHNALDRLLYFIHDSGGRFYRLTEKMPVHYLRLAQEPMTVPPEIDGIVPFMAGQTLPWSVVP